MAGSSPARPRLGIRHIFNGVRGGFSRQGASQPERGAKAPAAAGTPDLWPRCPDRRPGTPTQARAGCYRARPPVDPDPAKAEGDGSVGHSAPGVLGWVRNGVAGASAPMTLESAPAEGRSAGLAIPDSGGLRSHVAAARMPWRLSPPPGVLAANPAQDMTNREPRTVGGGAGSFSPPRPVDGPSAGAA